MHLSLKEILLKLYVHDMTVCAAKAVMFLQVYSVRDYHRDVSRKTYWILWKAVFIVLIKTLLSRD